MKINRRNFIKSSIFTTLYLTGFGLPIHASSKDKKNLIIIMLRGGMDGLCSLPIKGDKEFEKLRSKINLDKTLPLTSDFDLHPVLEHFHALWSENKASAIHATSIPYTGRSHFDGQNLMESGGLTPYKTKTGWLGRGMKIANLEANGLALALPMPLLLRGVPQNDNYFPSRGKLPTKQILNVLQSIYKESSEKELLSMLEIIQKRSSINSYGKSSRDNTSLAYEAGEKLKNPNGPRVAVFEVDGFDTHAAQGATNGAHADCLGETDSILGALRSSMRESFNNTLGDYNEI